MDLDELEARYRRDLEDGYQPFLVVGSAGTVSTGAVDPLPDLAAFCKERKLWFHVDGAYGAFAAALAGVPAELKALQSANSVALDPHKWLYAPLEVGCALVRNPAALRNAFSYQHARLLVCTPKSCCGTETRPVQNFPIGTTSRCNEWANACR